MKSKAEKQIKEKEKIKIEEETGKEKDHKDKHKDKKSEKSEKKQKKKLKHFKATTVESAPSSSPQPQQPYALSHTISSPVFRAPALGGEAEIKSKNGKDLALTQQLFSALFSQHPWHGASPGEEVPQKVSAYIEIVPTDSVKYELDKNSGLLKIDRPHRFSSTCPSLYGFIPQTYCGKHVAERCSEHTGKDDIVGDGDPLDICVLTSKPITHGDILVHCIPIGGFRMLDGNEADDKIIAVLENDPVYGDYRELKDCPKQLIDPLRHYFLTYKQIPAREENATVEISELYDRKEAHEIIERSISDYIEGFGEPNERIEQLSRILAPHIVS